MKTMKNILIGLLFMSALSQAQVSVNVNVGAPPAWGPAGYSNANYYYIPDIESYYDVRQSQYIYQSNGQWLRTSVLPAKHRNYNLYRGYKVVVVEPGNAPHMHYAVHKVKYKKYKGYRGKQATIGKGPYKKKGGNGHGHHKGKAHGKGKAKGHGGRD